MSAQTLDQALDAATGPGSVEVDEPGGATKVDLVEVDRLGVRIRSVTVGHPARDVVREAAELPSRIRAIPDALRPIEVDAGLGGAILRSDPSQMRRGRFFEVQVRPNHTEIRRYRVEREGREADDFTLTRDQLRDLVDEVRGTSS